MYTLYVADDEAVIREGIKNLLDWEALGFVICGEAGNGSDALSDILALSPSLVLMDIRMPKLAGLEVIEQAKAAGFTGKFIILSGFSDFSYAKTAMKNGVTHYLTKPIDEDELEKAVLELKAQIQTEQENQSQHEFLRQKSRNEILRDLILGQLDLSALRPDRINLSGSVWQVVLYESFHIGEATLAYPFSDLFQATTDSTHFDHFTLNGQNVLLLKTEYALERFSRFLDHYRSNPPQTGSPLDTLFIAYGAPVESLDKLTVSYTEAATLLSRRFFCPSGQHVLGFEEAIVSADSAKSPAKSSKDSASSPVKDSNVTTLEPANTTAGASVLKNAPDFCKLFTDYLQTFNRRMIAATSSELVAFLSNSHVSTSDATLYLIDLLLKIKENIVHRYSTLQIPCDSNTEIIASINHSNYLYEIIDYYMAQFERIMGAIGNSSRDSVLDDILHYIDHNYRQNLKLEAIAPLFGYNSSYLGKIFTKTVGESFNSYVDNIRIKHSITLLSDNRLKVYEIAEQVGYSNVDYFHKKFKKYTGMSPAEYRRTL